ncbi:DUF5702 domain-containing protein [Anaerosacchariphilus polymeriproducens]|uniref:Uncharacterized protein n=1 Tax=Anaerosacchariphilus polymeriproducens TaxID=1812858 RepID=A0A371AZR2_9FIRM|nr:DUF5702 domain-containing protein [Anaerosacchariphilus polymeriproducens]RDU25075.1 hypothetical protein DWV06_00825 [Anaerosacchariphilus polymeriproducens]
MKRFKARVERFKLNNLKGSITVFLTFTLFCLCSLICLTIESARLYGLKVQAINSLDLGLYSVFGEYNKEILENYDLFYIDSAYGEEYRKEKLERRLKEYMDFNLNPMKESNEKAFLDLWQIRIGNCNITKRICATDQNGISFRNQAIEYIGRKFKLEDKMKILDNIKKSKELSFPDLRNKLEQIIRLIRNGAENDPLLPAAQLIGNKVLSIVKNQEFSTKIIDLNKTLSNRNLNIFNKEQRGNETGEDEETIWQGYLLEKFKSYLDQEKSNSKRISNSALDYELEYILFGQSSDIKNLELVIEQIFQIRLEKNLTYLKNSTEKMNEMDNFIANLAIESLNLFPENMTKESIILLWSYGESLNDIYQLIQGNKVVFDKTDNTWRMDLNDLLNLPVSIKKEETSDEIGFSYRDYLQILLYLNRSTNQNIRSLDLIEENIRMNSDNKSIQINNFVEAVYVNCEFQGEHIFLQMPFQKMLFKKDYYFKKERGYTY